MEGIPAKPNVLLICIDDLRPELRSFGVDYISSPHIDALADQGRGFRRHYVQAPTCGASRYALLTGQYGGSSNSALFERAEKLAEKPDAFPPSMPAWFRQHGLYDGFRWVKFRTTPVVAADRIGTMRPFRKCPTLGIGTFLRLAIGSTRGVDAWFGSRRNPRGCDQNGRHSIG